MKILAINGSPRGEGMALAGHFAPAQAFQWMLARHLLLVPAIIFTIWFQKWYPTYGSVKGHN